MTGRAGEIYKVFVAVKHGLYMEEQQIDSISNKVEDEVVI